MNDLYKKIAEIEKDFWLVANRLDDDMDNLYRFNNSIHLLYTISKLESIIEIFKKELIQ